MLRGFIVPNATGLADLRELRTGDERREVTAAGGESRVSCARVAGAEAQAS